jgi:hypothetical protein
MSDAPKIVHDRLRAAAPRETHPDADVLTAFVEQALSGTEREGVVRHLSRCGDCREVVALSIPPSVEAARPEAARDETSVRTRTERSQALFAWPNLRWAAMAAGVVVASVLILRPGKPTDSTLGNENLAAQGKAQAPTPDATPNSVASSATEPTGSYSSTPSTKPDNALALERRSSRRDEQPLGRAQTRAAMPPAYLANNKRVDSLRDKSNYSFEAGKLAMQSPSTRGVGANSEISTAQQAGVPSSELGAVNGTAEEVRSAPVQGTLIARNDVPALPVEKAKPAVKEKEEVQLKSQVQEVAPQTKFAPAYVESNSALARQKQTSKKSKDAGAQWSLAQGKLQRSLDAGASWQIVLQLQQPLLSFGERGSDVWAGGQGGALFHSVDGGTTWTMIQPSTKAGALTGDIVAIEIRSSAEIVLSTSTGESWTTADAGKTWEKK